MVTIFEIEHIMPRALSGRSVFENLCLACPNCNRYKSDRVLATDPVTGGEAPLFHPQRDRWEDHFGWSSDFAEIISFTSTGRGTCALLRMNRPQLIRVRRLWVAVGEHPPERRHS